MNVIPSKMIDVSFNLDKSLSLEDFIKMNANSSSIPISLFGKDTSTVSIEKAVSYLRGIGGGCVSIPPSSQYNELKIQVFRDRNRDLRVRYEYQNYKYPTGNDARPYTLDAWKSGDIIFNTDYNPINSLAIGWVCVESGIPGKWVPYLNHEIVYNSYYDNLNEELRLDISRGATGVESRTTLVKDVTEQLSRTLVLQAYANKWEGNMAPYTQKIYNTKISVADNPMLAYTIDKGMSVEEIKEIKKCFAYIDGGTTYNGYIELVCGEKKPTVDFNVVYKV